MIEEIKKAKIQLYKLLLDTPVDNLTDNEVDLMYLLSKDKDVQEVLGKGK